MWFLSIAFFLCVSSLKLNEIQVIGTHNSYHVSDGFLIFNYTHLPLKQQLCGGVRSLELDFHPRLSESDDDFPVYHIDYMDTKTTCSSLRECLTQTREWSRKNANHVPISFMLEPKKSDFTSADYELLDDIIFDIWGSDLITPDSVREGDLTLSRSVLTRQGWPELDDVRGKAMFLLDKCDDYVRYQEDLSGRAMFPLWEKTKITTENDTQAIVKIDDPFDQDIMDFVKKGYIVRTRADAKVVSGSSKITSEMLAANFFEKLDLNSDDKLTDDELKDAIKQFAPQNWTSTLEECQVISDINSEQWMCVWDVYDRWNTCLFGDLCRFTTTAAANVRRREALLSGGHIMTTDFAMMMTEEGYTFQIGSEAICNNVLTITFPGYLNCESLSSSSASSYTTSTQKEPIYCQSSEANYGKVFLIVFASILGGGLVLVPVIYAIKKVRRRRTQKFLKLEDDGIVPKSRSEERDSERGDELSLGSDELIEMSEVDSEL